MEKNGKSLVSLLSYQPRISPDFTNRGRNSYRIPQHMMFCRNIQELIVDFVLFHWGINEISEALILWKSGVIFHLYFFFMKI